MINGMNKNQSRILQGGQGRLEKVTFEQIPEGGEEGSHEATQHEVPHVQGLSSANALTEERSLRCAGTAEREVRLAQTKRGKRSRCSLEGYRAAGRSAGLSL